MPKDIVFKIKVVALLSTAAGPSAVVTATIRRPEHAGKLLYVFLEDRDVTALDGLIRERDHRGVMPPPWDGAILRSHAIDPETGRSPDDVPTFDRVSRRWPDGDGGAWVEVDTWATYFTERYLDWQGGTLTLSTQGYRLIAMRRLAVAAGHNPEDRELAQLGHWFASRLAAERAAAR